MTISSLRVSTIGRAVAVAGISLAMVLGFVVAAIAATPAELSVDTINGAPPTGHCLAGTLTLTGHGKTGGEGSSWHVAIGWGDGATTTIDGAPGITSGDLGGGGHAFTFSATHTPVATSTGLTVMIYHSSLSGSDGPVIIVSQCVAPPTTGVVTIKKVVSGGSAQPSDFTLHFKNSSNAEVSTSASSSPFAGSSHGSDFIVTAGTYTTSETANANYTPSFSGTGCASNGTVTVHAGDNLVCTVTNTFVPPTTLTLVKTITNDNGGSAAATAWTLAASGPTPISGATGSAGVTNATVTPGTYTLSESGGPSGYTASTYSCVKNGGSPVVSNSITLATSDIATCTINNNDNAPSLTLNKVVSNTHGGTAANTAWTLTATGASGSPTNLTGTTPVTSGATFKADTYTLAESGGPAGYTGSAWVCTGTGSQGDATHVTLGVGQSETCTITNSDIAPTLKLHKVVTNDNGGTNTSHDWTLTATGSGGFSDLGDSATFHTVTPGVSYGLSESVVPGYAAGSWSCDGGTLVGSSVTLLLGQHVTCTISNNDVPPFLKLVKLVVNAFRGVSTPSDWTLFAAGPTPISGAGSATSDSTFSAGSYTLSESAGPSGYNASDWGCSKNGSATTTGSSLSLAPGDSALCIITNSDKKPGTLHVVKHVINDGPEGFAGTAVAGDFTLTVTGGNPSLASFAGSETGTDVTIDAGASYSVSETGGPTDKYGTTLTGDCSGTMPEGGTPTCTVTNNDNPPTTGGLTVVKVVTNDNGGTAVVSDFTLHVGTTTVTSGQNNQFAGGTYTVSETGGPGGYQATFSGACNADGVVTVVNGTSQTCTITNDDIAPSLTLVKEVSNTHGGTATAADWTLTAQGPDTISGAGGATSSPSFKAGTYTLTESAGPAGYTAGSWSCTNKVVVGEGNQITLGIGQSTTCTIVNSDTPPTLHVVKHVVNDNGGTKVAGDFTLHVQGTNVSSASFPGSETGTDVTLDAGPYSVSEDAVAGYGETLSADCSGTISVGETKTCTVTNNDGKVTLTIVKNTLGGDGTFTFGVTGQDNANITTIGGTGSTTVALDAGTYTVTEQVPSGWSLGNGHPSCVSGETTVGTTTSNGATIPLVTGNSVTCTFTNSKLPTLTIVKRTVGGDGSFSFSLTHSETVDATTTLQTSGGAATSSVITLAVGVNYNLTENVPEGWTLQNGHPVCVYNGESVGNSVPNGEFLTNIDAGDVIVCTFTNTNNNPATDISVTKSVDNTSPDSGGQVTYTLTVANNGPADATGVVAHDALPAGVDFVSTTTADTVGVYNSGTGNWTIGNLAKGSSVTLHIVVHVSAGAGQHVTNSVTVTSTNPDSNSDNNGASADFTVHTTAPTGGGGGGGGNGPLILGGGGGNGLVLGTTTGQVLGVSCGLYMDRYVRTGKKNNVEQVKKLQTFLNKWQKSGLPITGFYGPLSLAAVSGFQGKYSDQILKPWNISGPTGIVYQTTLRQINLLECPDLALQLPPLVEWSKSPADDKKPQ